MFRFRARLPAFIAIASCTALALWGCCTAEKEAGVVFVAVLSRVSGQPQSTPATPTISYARHQQLIWKASPGRQLTEIKIALGGKPSPFQRCAAGQDPCSIKCDYGVCASGPIAAGLNIPVSGLYYDYAVAIATEAQGDPGFIIRP